jgi:hypothetical protein
MVFAKTAQTLTPRQLSPVLPDLLLRRIVFDLRLATVENGN